MIKVQVSRRVRSKNSRDYINYEVISEAAKRLQSRIINELPNSSYMGPSSSQIPYDFNDSRGREFSANSVSVTRLSKQYSNMKLGQEQNNSFPAQDLFQYSTNINYRDVEFQDIPLKSDVYIEDEDEVIHNYIRKQQLKHTVRTAGFPQIGLVYKGFGMHESGKKDKFGAVDGLAVANIQQSGPMNQMHQQYVIYNNSRSQHIRSKTPRLTFMYQNQNTGQSKDESRQESQKAGRKLSQRQSSNRSLTYSNNRTISNNPSNNPSHNASSNKRKKTISPSGSISQMPRQGTQQSLSHSQSGHHSSGNQQNSNQLQNMSRLDKIDSEQNMTEKRSQMRKSSRKKSTNTKVSIMNQMSGFTPFILPDNPVYNNTDYGMSKFEQMKSFKVFFPHNNYENVLQRLNKFMAQDKKQQQALRISPYTNKSFVVRKIKLIKQLLEQPLKLSSKSRSHKIESEPIIMSAKQNSLVFQLFEQ